MTDCQVLRLGLQPYLQVRELQESLAAQISAGDAPPTLLLLEHPHTYTFGRRGKAANLLWDEATLRRRGVEAHWIDRGGDVTYHGPGQLVGYPLLPLGRLDHSGRLPQADYVGYVRRLEEVLIRALAALGLAAAQRPGATGVWIQPDVASRCPHCPPAARKAASKIASIGIRVDSRGVSRHGFALNVAPDMSYWDGIIACDLPDSPAISIADLLEPAPTIAQASEAVVQAFGRVFSFQMRFVPHTEQLPA
jgi:lipoate-protein ligase B